MVVGFANKDVAGDFKISLLPDGCTDLAFAGCGCGVGDRS